MTSFGREGAGMERVSPESRSQDALCISALS